MAGHQAPHPGPLAACLVVRLDPPRDLHQHDVQHLPLPGHDLELPLDLVPQLGHLAKGLQVLRCKGVHTPLGNVLQLIQGLAPNQRLVPRALHLPPGLQEGPGRLAVLLEHPPRLLLVGGGLQDGGDAGGEGARRGGSREGADRLTSVCVSGYLVLSSLSAECAATVSCISSTSSCNMSSREPMRFSLISRSTSLRSAASSSFCSWRSLSICW